MLICFHVFQGILTEEVVSTIPVLILGNKIDKLGVCRGKEQLIQDLGIHIHLSENVSTFLNLYSGVGGGGHDTSLI